MGDSKDENPVAEALISAPPIPRWVGLVFIMGGALMIPWLVYLGTTLPVRYSAANYSLAWVGFDVFVILLLVGTGVAAWRGAPRVTTLAAMTATVLIIDAWFDIALANDRRDLISAVLLAGFVEIPVAIACLWVSLHSGNMLANRYQLLRAAWLSVRGNAVDQDELQR